MKSQEILLEKLIETNRSEEETIRSTIYKMESDIESKISKYDQEMTVLQVLMLNYELFFVVECNTILSS